ncbi:Auxin-responsive protein SAUR32 [Heracleum sosnowskyi]|uniref:Auxin-responsive protein SAUR32 n=1 Tax=Heracleum sosnowskyi TaxID=360622 RepID=A0AAD8MBU9_9APIA|nr:Auxin-responsive protein SAUR32 [Heracleum sosnowskyi]
MEKKMEVKKGCIAVQVGLEEENEMPSRFVIPISYLYNPLFRQLLDRAHEVYGYHISGPLKLPCSVDEFVHLRWQIEKESGNHRRQRRHNHHHLSTSLSFRSC